MIWLEIAPLSVLILSGVGFVLSLIADNWPIERRVKIIFVMIFFACCAILAMH